MGDGGFEPPKALPADLQSVPFGHSGNRPCFSFSHRLRLYHNPPKMQVFFLITLPGKAKEKAKINARFFLPLLSYHYNDYASHAHI